MPLIANSHSSIVTCGSHVALTSTRKPLITNSHSCIVTCGSHVALTSTRIIKNVVKEPTWKGRTLHPTLGAPYREKLDVKKVGEKINDTRVTSQEQNAKHRCHVLTGFGRLLIRSWENLNCSESFQWYNKSSDEQISRNRIRNQRR